MRACHHLRISIVPFRASPLPLLPVKRKMLEPQPSHPLSCSKQMIKQKTIKLNDGADVPIYAFGTASKLYRKDARAAVTMAITEAGIRHIDTAAEYRNEGSVGKAIGLDKAHIFVTTKCKLSGNKMQYRSEARS